MGERQKVVGFSEDAKIAVENPLVRIEYRSGRGDGRGGRGGRDGGGGGSGGKSGWRGGKGGEKAKDVQGKEAE